MATIKQIRIPLRANEVNIKKITPYLPTVYARFMSNRMQIRADYDAYCLSHEILDKTRPHGEDINNIVLSPHLSAMIDWKAGYVVGNPIKYAQSKNTQTDDITVLNKYIRNSNKQSIDSEVLKWAYATGFGYYFIQPKTENFNVKHEAPFDIYAMEADSCAKVYSSYLGNRPLFDVLYTNYEKIDERGGVKIYSVLSIYLPYAMYVYETVNGSDFALVDTQERGIYRKLPLVEKKYSHGIGIVSKSRYLQNAIDRIASDSVDNIQDIVNEVWVFLNVVLGKTTKEKTENFRAMKKAGAVEIHSANPQITADVKTISTKLNLDNVLKVRQVLLREMYDCVGVPIASSDISSGNVTKGGGEVANGYENAYNRALDDKNSFITADNELLERMIFICHNTPDCSLDELFASEIEIKYCFNMTDNMLTKSQSYVNFVEKGMPPSMAGEITKIFTDAEAQGKIVEDNILKQKEQEKEITE